MTLWLFAFVDALTQFVIASSAAIWYFSQENCHAPVRRSFYRGFRYHMGSLAFGSLLVAIVQLIRLIVEFMKKQAGKSAENPAVKALLAFLTCYLACVERIIKFINKNAYIQVIFLFRLQSKEKASAWPAKMPYSSSSETH